MIWLLSQIRQAVDNGQEVSRKIRFSRWAFLKEVRRHTGGTEYKRLEASIARLKNTTISTSIRAKKRRTVMFNWFEYAMPITKQFEGVGQLAAAWLGYEPC